MGLNDLSTNPGGTLVKAVATGAERTVLLDGTDSDGHPLVPCDTLNVRQDPEGAAADIKVAWHPGDIAAGHYTFIQSGFSFTFRKVRRTAMYVDVSASTDIQAWN